MQKSGLLPLKFTEREREREKACLSFIISFVLSSFHTKLIL